MHQTIASNSLRQQRQWYHWPRGPELLYQEETGTEYRECSCQVVDLGGVLLSFRACYVQEQQETDDRGGECHDPQKVDVMDGRTARDVAIRSLLLRPLGQSIPREQEAHDDQGDLSNERPVA